MPAGPAVRIQCCVPPAAEPRLPCHLHTALSLATMQQHPAAAMHTWPAWRHAAAVEAPAGAAPMPRPAPMPPSRCPEPQLSLPAHPAAPRSLQTLFQAPCTKPVVNPASATVKITIGPQTAHARAAKVPALYTTLRKTMQLRIETSHSRSDGADRLLRGRNLASPIALKGSGCHAQCGVQMCHVESSSTHQLSDITGAVDGGKCAGPPHGASEGHTD